MTSNLDPRYNGVLQLLCTPILLLLLTLPHYVGATVAAAVLVAGQTQSNLLQKDAVSACAMLRSATLCRAALPYAVQRYAVRTFARNSM
jgi:hypothetical protein